MPIKSYILPFKVTSLHLGMYVWVCVRTTRYRNSLEIQVTHDLPKHWSVCILIFPEEYLVYILYRLAPLWELSYMRKSTHKNPHLTQTTSTPSPPVSSAQIDRKFIPNSTVKIALYIRWRYFSFDDWFSSLLLVTSKLKMTKMRSEYSMEFFYYFDLFIRFYIN